MKSFKLISILSLLICQLSLAEEIVAELCIIALGGSPQREYSESGAMLLPRGGAVPPSVLFYKSQGEEGEWTSVNVRLNSASILQTVPAEKELHFYKKSSSGYSKYLTLAPMAQGTRKMIVLMPSNTNDTMWVSKPYQHSILLDSEKIDGSDIAMINLSKASLSCQVANEKLTLRSKKSFYYSHHETGLCRIAISYGNQNKFAYNSGVKIHGQGSRYLYVFYDANPRTNAGSDVGVFRMMIPAASCEQKNPQSH